MLRFQQQKKRLQILRMNKLSLNKYKGGIGYLLSFVIPTAVMIFLCHHFMTAEPDGPILSQITGRMSQLSKTFFESVRLDSEAATRIREMLSTGSSVEKVDIVRELFSVHSDPFFLLLTLIGLTTYNAFRAFFFVRFGLAGVAMYHCMKSTVRCSRSSSLMLSTAYAVSVVMMTAGQNTGLMNLMIMMPIIISCIDHVLRKGDIKSWLLMSLAVFGGITAGVFVYVSLFLFIIGASLTIYFGIKPMPGFRRFCRMISATLSGYILGLIVILPALHNVTGTPGFVKSFSEGTVRFKLLDMLTGSIDGRYPIIYSADTTPPFAVSMIVTMLVVLFLLNSRVPYKMKIASMMTVLLFYVSCVYTGADYLFSIWGLGGAFVYARIVMVAALLVFLAGISIRNAGSLDRNSVYAAIFVSLALIVVANSSSIENRPRPVALFLSAAAVIVLGMVILKGLTAPNKRWPYFILIAELALNCSLCLGNAIFAPTSGLRTNLITDTVHYDTEFRTTNTGIMPLLESSDFTSNYYVVLTSDLSDIGDVSSYPEQVNMMARAAMTNDIFEHTDTDLLNLEGLTDYGLNHFGGDDINHGVITIRAYFMEDPGTTYFVYSGFKSRQNLMEIYEDRDEFNVFEGPFMMEFNPKLSYTAMKLSIETPGTEVHEYNVWSVNDESLERFNSFVIPYSGYEFSGFVGSISAGGTRSVVTSLPYTDKLAVNVNGHRVPTYSVCDRLSFSIDNAYNGELNVSIVNPSEDIVAGVVTSVVYLFMITSIYIYSIKRNKKAESLHAQQEDN